MHIKNLEDFKKFAQEKFSNVIPGDLSDPINMLWSIDWNIQIDKPTDQGELTISNINLDTNYCFGRTVMASVLLDKYFPGTVFLVGEVWEDLLQRVLLRQIKEKCNDESFLKELLMYEDPHTCLVFEKGQFDPGFTVLGNELKYVQIDHPTIESFPVWECNYAGYLSATASVEKSSSKKLALLDEAEETCPGTVMIRQHRLKILALSGQIKLAAEICFELINKSPGAKRWYVMSELTGDTNYLVNIVDKYGSTMLKVLEKEVNKNGSLGSLRSKI